MKRRTESVDNSGNRMVKKQESNETMLIDSVLLNLSTNIEYLLKINRMDKSMLASRLGIKHQTLSKYLDSKDGSPVPVPLRKLIAIAEIFGVTPDALLYHNLEQKDRASYVQDIASMLQRPMFLPECALRRYQNRKWYLYYYTIKEGMPILGEALIDTKGDFKFQYIQATVKTENQLHHMKLVADYPRYIYLYGINALNPMRFFIMFSDPEYTIENDFIGGLAICVSIIPECKNGFPGMQFVALSSIKLDIVKQEQELHEFLTVPNKKRMLRLHPEQNEKYIRWLLQQRTLYS